jgi:hypothetical protein
MDKATGKWVSVPYDYIFQVRRNMIFSKSNEKRNEKKRKETKRNEKKRKETKRN